MYDIKFIETRLRDLRIERYSQYKQNEGNSESAYQKYKDCKNQESFGNMVGIGRQAVVSWETGDSIPSIKNLIKICDALDCSIDYLLGSGDLPEVDPISKAYIYSGIDPKIIKQCKEDTNYLECLNFFMLPENCSALFNKVTLSAWKKHWIIPKFSGIKEPLIEIIKDIFNTFNATTPFDAISEKKFREFLEHCLSKKKTENKYDFKDYISQEIYEDFSLNNKFMYSEFLDYLVDETFEPLSQLALIELQKIKLSHTFADLFTKYLNEV